MNILIKIITISITILRIMRFLFDMGNCIKNNKVVVPNIFTADLSRVQRFTYNGQYKYCRFVDIYDGDTGDICFWSDNRFVRAGFRFYGYDSAEMKPLKSIITRDSIIAQAHRDKRHLESLLADQYLVVQFMKNEKYGRMMGNVWRVRDVSMPDDKLAEHPELTDDNCINKLMIKAGHGYIYTGGPKLKCK
jgi:hypothetical protein